MLNMIAKRVICLVFVVTISIINLFSQETFNKAEFAARRAKVFEKIGDGVAVVFANETHRFAVKYRESPDFYYLTGIEEPNAILVLVGKTKRTVIFANRSDEWRQGVEGPGIFDMKNAVEYYGIDRLLGLDQFFYSYILSLSKTAFVPLTAPDDLQFDRGEMFGVGSPLLNHPLNPSLMRYKQAVNKLRETNPHLTFQDINPILDELRWVKSPYEIERMRKAGKIGAEGVKEAIKGTKAGMFEYELEAAARFIYTKHGARGDAFLPIVASGPNTLILHYMNNNRKMQDGEVVLMDYGADYEYYTSDITRTWAVSGKFTTEQEKMYRCVLEARNAIIGMMKPGIKVSDMQNTTAKIYEKHGFGEEFKRSGNYVGHFIGMSVHDVGTFENPLVPGVVFNVEPTLTNEKLQTHIRLEDTVLITQNGAENLTKDVPAEIEEIYALQKQKAIGQ